MIANGLNGSAPLNRIREFQRFSHNDSLKARMILISQGATWSASVATGFNFLCDSTLSATASSIEETPDKSVLYQFLVGWSPQLWGGTVNLPD